MSNIVRSDGNTIRDLKGTIDVLGPELSKSTYSAWIYFKVGSIEFNTRGKDVKYQGNLYSTNNTNQAGNYFMSMTNTKNGSGQANNFSVCVAYAPDVGASDVNYIDMCLYGNKNENANAVLNECELQYGYNEISVESPRYVGQLLDYKVEIRDGMLYYTMTGYSSIVAEKEVDHVFEQVGSYEEDGETKTITSGKRPTEIARDAFKDYCEDYEVVIDESALNHDKITSIPSHKGTVFSYVDMVLKNAIDENSTGDEDDTNKSIYFYTISDVQGSKKITIKRVNPSEYAESQVSVVFDWMGGFGMNSTYTGNLVINFVTEYHGAIALSAKRVKNSTEGQQYSYGINSYGEVVKTKSISGNAGSAGDYIDEEESKSLSAWAEATQHACKATLTTVGLPCHIPIGEYIRVRPLIYGTEHLTGGVFMITGSEDIIDSNGFTTTINLVKVGT